MSETNLSYSLTFNIKIAEHFKSADVAVVYNHILFWLRNNEKKGINQIDGKTWMYETAKQMADHFGYMDEQAVKKCIVKLVEAGFLIREYKSKNKFDKTSWYCLPDDHFSKNLFEGSKENLPMLKREPCIYKDKQEDKHHQQRDVSSEFVEPYQNEPIGDDDENLKEFNGLLKALEKSKETPEFSKACNRAALLKLSKNYSAKLVGQIIYRFTQEKPKGIKNPMGWLTEQVKEEFELFKYKQREGLK